MEVTKILDIIDLSPEERKKVEAKRFGAFTGVTADEVREEKAYLNSNGIYIDKAREVTVYANTKKDLEAKVNMATSMGEIEMYRNEPLRLNANVIDVNRRVQACKQSGRAYKDASGKYANFLFSEIEFSKTVAPTIDFSPKESGRDVEAVTLEQVVEEAAVMEENITSTPVEEEPAKESKIIQFPSSVDIKEYQQLDTPEEASTITFEDLQASTQEMHRELQNDESANALNHSNIIPFDLSNTRKSLEAQKASAERELQRISSENNNDAYKQSFASQLEDETIMFGDEELDNYVLKRVANL